MHRVVKVAAFDVRVGDVILVSHDDKHSVQWNHRGMPVRSNVVEKSLDNSDGSIYIMVENGNSAYVSPHVHVDIDLTMTFNKE